MRVKGITFRRLKTAWTGKPSPTNGSYGLYPVLCEKVLIDSCIAIGASDAGIYVGQSKYITVRNCTAFQNVAGIEIENSLYAEVYNNVAEGNTGGILVFDLPDLIQKKGGFVRVYNNLIKENNLANFAPKGNIVGNVPKGTGMMVLATSQVEIFDNKILNHSTVGIAIISYFMTEKKNKDKGYYPYPTSINIHDNLFERKPRRVPMDSRFGQLYRVKLKFGRKIPQIIFDGILDPKLVGTDGKYLPEYAICVRNNINQSTSFLDADHDFKNVLVGPDLFECSPVSIKSNQF
jgi:parallel beta-helix repeat protein